MDVKKYATVKEMAGYFPFFSVSSLRHLIFENKNGIHECMLKVGGKILFDTNKFQEWMDKQKMEMK